MQAVRIKFNRYGIELIMNPQISFADLLEAVRVKFFEGDEFFQNADMAIIFEGRTLTLDEEDQIIEMIESVSRIHVVCVIERNALKEALIREQIEKFTGDAPVQETTERAPINYLRREEVIRAEEAEKAARIEAAKKAAQAIQKEEAKAHPGVVMSAPYQSEGADVQRVEDEDGTAIIQCNGCYRGNVNEGEILVSEGELIVFGDVVAGAGLMAQGNIVVLGSVKGNVFAGSEGDKKCVVVAHELDPGALRIGNADYIPEQNSNLFKRSRRRHEMSGEMQIAFERYGEVIVESINSDVIAEIH